MDNINISGFNSSSIVDGPGIRFTVYTQGCIHHCRGCHNPESWTDRTNKLYSVEQIIELIESEALAKQVTLSGGDPLNQPVPIIKLASRLKELGYQIWLYTGYTLEEVQANPEMAPILDVIDVLVDGKFEQDKLDITTSFKGSTNQRIINLSE